MNKIRRILHRYRIGRNMLAHEIYQKSKEATSREKHKPTKRYDVINFLLGTCGKKTKYLEIGVRNPEDNYNKIKSNVKYSVDPGIEFVENPVDFPTTSDDFFTQLKSGKILTPNIRFDVIFIDGLHLADQVYRDLENALEFLTDDGFVVMHDCNPPTEWHAREQYVYTYTPAGYAWNGTTWKAFYRARTNPEISVCCVDSDWGIGIVSKKKGLLVAPTKVKNPFYEYSVLDSMRKESLNLVSFDELKSKINQ